MNPSYVYILASKRNGTLYIGVTSDLEKRLYQHRTGEIPGFTEKHKVHRLVYFEMFGSIADAINREKTLKKCKRIWKLHLIEDVNPDWKDLWQETR